jgi:hypothetical protein
LNKKLQNVTRTLRELIRSLPAVRANCSAEVLNRHLQLIAHFQRQYDQLVAATRSTSAAGQA